VNPHERSHLVHKAARLEVRCGYAFDFVVILGVIVASMSVLVGTAGISGDLAGDLVSTFSWLAPNVPAMYAISGWRRKQLGVEPRKLRVLMLAGWIPLLAAVVPAVVWMAHLKAGLDPIVQLILSGARVDVFAASTELVRSLDHDSVWPAALSAVVTAAWFVACLVENIPRPRQTFRAVVMLEEGMRGAPSDLADAQVTDANNTQFL